MPKVCSKCGSGNPDDARYCGMCGHLLATPPEPPAAQSLRCGECGHENPLDARFCGHCGVNVLGTVILRGSEWSKTAPSAPRSLFPEIPARGPPAAAPRAASSPPPSPTAETTIQAPGIQRPAPPAPRPPVSPTPTATAPEPNGRSPVEPRGPSAPPEAKSIAAVAAAQRIRSADAAAKLRRILWIATAVVATAAASSVAWFVTRPPPLVANLDLPAALPMAASAADDGASAGVPATPSVAATSLPASMSATTEPAAATDSPPVPPASDLAPHRSTASAASHPAPAPAARTTPRRTAAEKRAARERAAREAKAAAAQRDQAAARARADQDAARREAQASAAATVAAAPPAAAPAPAKPPQVGEICAGRSGISLGYCEQHQCLAAEHASEAVCIRVREAEDRRRGFPR